MRKQIYKALNKLYGILMSIAFWGGVIPLLPFLIAIFFGGATGEAIALFLHEKYYPWVIALASIAVIVGLVSMYVGKEKSLSTESFKRTGDSRKRG